MHKGGVLFVDSADKAARFIWLCDAFNVPLVFLADVPGFMIGTAGRAAGHHPPRRQDDHRGHRGDGAEDLASSCARPTAPGSTRCAGRRSSPTRPSRCRPRKIAVMGPEAAVNAVFANKIAAIEDPDERAAFVAERRGRVRGRRRPPAPRRRARRRRGGRARRPARRARHPLRAGRDAAAARTSSAATAFRPSDRGARHWRRALVRDLRSLPVAVVGASRRHLPRRAAATVDGGDAMPPRRRARRKPRRAISLPWHLKLLAVGARGVPQLPRRARGSSGSSISS